MIKRNKVYVVKISCIIGIILSIFSISVLIRDYHLGIILNLAIVFNLFIVFSGVLTFKLSNVARLFFIVFLSIGLLNTIIIVMCVATHRLFVPLYVYQIMLFFSFVLFPNFIYFEYFSSSSLLPYWYVFYWGAFLTFIFLPAAIILLLTNSKVKNRFIE